MSDQTSQQATVRIRINHSRTQKAGWQHETTVEVSGALLWGEGDAAVEGSTIWVGPIGQVESSRLAAAPLDNALEKAMRMADRIGREESARRNALDQEGIPA